MVRITSDKAAELLFAGIPHFDFKKGIGPTGDPELSANLGKEGTLLGTVCYGLGRPVEHGKLHMYAEIFIKETVQGLGLGRELLCNLIDYTQARAADKLEFYALEAGTYAWLRMGFLPTREDFGFLKEHLNEQKQILDLTPAETEIVDAICLSKKPEAVRMLFGLTSSDNTTSIAWQLLWDTEYYLQLNLKNPESMRIFSEYTGWKDRERNIISQRWVDAISKIQQEGRQK
jgi:hypothetical protein